MTDQHGQSESILILHIGYPKTGTSWLQSFLDRNERLLEASGVKYLTDGRSTPAGGRVDNHYSLAWKLLYRPVEESTEVWGRIAREVQAGTNRYCVVSSEMFVDLPASAIGTLHSLIADVEIRVLVWLRPQADAIHSRYLQAVKEGHKMPDIECYLREEINSGRWHYSKRIREWEIFGRENLVVRPYDRAQLLSADIVADFRNALGIGEDPWVDANEPASAASNTSIGPKSYAALQYVINHPDGFPLPSADRLEREGKWHSTAFEDLRLVLDKLGWNDAPLNLLTADLTARCHAAYSKENVAVARDYLGREDGRLFADLPGSMSKTEVPELTTDDWVRILGGLLERIEHKGVDDTATPGTVGSVKGQRRIEQWRSVIHSKLKHSF